MMTESEAIDRLAREGAVVLIERCGVTIWLGMPTCTRQVEAIRQIANAWLDQPREYEEYDGSITWVGQIRSK